MSWLDNINETLQITTGDGAVYQPDYVLTTKTVEYNVAQFDFPEIIGSLVERGTPKSPTYALEIIFQGENHLELFEAFEKSAQDRRPWTFAHPIFGKKLVQPMALTFDPRGFNTTRITGEIMETILREYPATSTDPTEEILNGLDEANALNEAEFAADYNPTVNDLDSLANTTSDAYTAGVSSAPNQTDLNAFIDAYNVTRGLIRSTGATAAQIGAALTQLSGAPSYWATTAQIRLAVYAAQFRTLFNGVANIKSLPQKLSFQNLGLAYLNGMILSALTPLDGDFDTTEKVQSAIDTLVANYNEFVSNLDELQSTSGDVINGFVANFTLLQAVSLLVSQTASNLQQITVNGAQKRQLYVEADTNAVILAHRFYGPSDDDSNLIKFINQNNIQISEMYQILKDRLVVYYV